MSGDLRSNAVSDVQFTPTPLFATTPQTSNPAQVTTAESLISLSPRLMGIPTSSLARATSLQLGASAASSASPHGSSPLTAHSPSSAAGAGKSSVYTAYRRYIEACRSGNIPDLKLLLQVLPEAVRKFEFVTGVFFAVQAGHAEAVRLIVRDQAALHLMTDSRSALAGTASSVLIPIAPTSAAVPAPVHPAGGSPSSISGTSAPPTPQQMSDKGPAASEGDTEAAMTTRSGSKRRLRGKAASAATPPEAPAAESGPAVKEAPPPPPVLPAASHSAVWTSGVSLAEVADLLSTSPAMSANAGQAPLPLLLPHGAHSSVTAASPAKGGGEGVITTPQSPSSAGFAALSDAPPNATTVLLRLPSMLQSAEETPRGEIRPEDLQAACSEVLSNARNADGWDPLMVSPREMGNACSCAFLCASVLCYPP
jgi:hypothetical protein